MYIYTYVYISECMAHIRYLQNLDVFLTSEIHYKANLELLRIKQISGYYANI